MIISSNRKASLEEFSLFLNNTNLFLNELAKNNNDYFLDKNAQKLEIEVFKALVKCSKNTIFENSIELVSSKYFPDLLRYLILTYTNSGEVILDNTIGSGSTAIACLREGRKFIGFEKDEKYFQTAQERIKKELSQPRLF